MAGRDVAGDKQQTNEKSCFSVFLRVTTIDARLGQGNGASRCAVAAPKYNSTRTRRGGGRGGVDRAGGRERGGLRRH